MAKDKKEKKDKGGKKDKSSKGGSAKTVDIGEVELLNVVLSYPHLYEKHASVSGGTPKYASDFIINPETKSGKENIKRCEAAIKRVEKDKFDKVDPRYKAGRKAFMEGNEIISQKTDETPPELVDMMVIKCKNDRRITLVDRRGDTATEKDDLFHGGAIVNPIIRFYAIDDAEKGGRGLYATIDGMQFVDEGERFGAAPLSGDRFGNIEDDGDDDEDFPDKGKKSGKDKDKKSGKDKDKEKSGKDKGKEKSGKDKDKKSGKKKKDLLS